MPLLSIHMGVLKMIIAIKFRKEVKALLKKKIIVINSKIKMMTGISYDDI